MFKYLVGQKIPNGATLRGVCLSEYDPGLYIILAEYGRQYVTWKANEDCETYGGSYFTNLHSAHKNFCERLSQN